ncbi:hypothetical protein WJX74_008337 [Apatococcus lobatus]|uniref:Uncharacterized protein n=1 Tax=Apatococcus lobatus TaxID=904363 RepID=A0AAW1RBG5_9CHLO
MSLCGGSYSHKTQRTAQRTDEKDLQVKREVCGCRSDCIMEESIRRSKRMRHATEDPSFYYSPATRKPKDDHVPCALQGSTNANKLQEAGSATIDLSANACSRLTKSARAALSSNEFAASEQLHEGSDGAALPDAGTHQQNGIAPHLALEDECQKAGSPQPSRDTSHDSSSSQVLMLKADSKPGTGLIRLQQHGVLAPAYAKGPPGKQTVTAAARTSRHKSKPHRSPFE